MIILTFDLRQVWLVSAVFFIINKRYVDIAKNRRKREVIKERKRNEMLLKNKTK
jgi:hypothetical protein